MVRENAQEVRGKVLKYLMVRRTRSEIALYFAEDLQDQSLKFPEVADPNPIFYELNEHEDQVFHKTIEWSPKSLNMPVIPPCSISKEEFPIPKSWPRKIWASS